MISAVEAELCSTLSTSALSTVTLKVMSCGQHGTELAVLCNKALMTLEPTPHARSSTVDRQAVAQGRMTDSPFHLTVSPHELSTGWAYYTTTLTELWRMLSSGIGRHVDLVRNDVSKERAAPIIRVKRISELNKTLAITSKAIRLCRRYVKPKRWKSHTVSHPRRRRSS
jgi:hypothetical protein